MNKPTHKESNRAKLRPHLICVRSNNIQLVGPDTNIKTKFSFQVKVTV